MNKPDLLENLNSPPKKQWASSIGHQLLGSLPASIALALLGTILCHKMLPEAAAAALASQIQAACLGSGVISTGLAAFGFQARSNALTGAKLANQGAQIGSGIPQSFPGIPGAMSQEDDGTPDADSE